jgi:hypothetical protein
VDEIMESAGSARLDYGGADVTGQTDRARRRGVRSTPPMAVDGERSVTGVPSADGLRAALPGKI